MLARICRWVSYGVLAAAVVGLSWWYVQGGRLLSVQTGSMVPSFQPGDALLVQPIVYRDLKPGQIVSYHSSGNPKVIVSHRIIALQPDHQTMTTKGDSLSDSDMPITKQQLVGQVTAVLPGFGKVLDFFHQPSRQLVGLYLPAALIIGWELWRLGNAHGSHYRLYGYRKSRISLMQS